MSTKVWADRFTEIYSVGSTAFYASAVEDSNSRKLDYEIYLMEEGQRYPNEPFHRLSGDKIRTGWARVFRGSNVEFSKDNEVELEKRFRDKKKEIKEKAVDIKESISYDELVAELKHRIQADRNIKKQRDLYYREDGEKGCQLVETGRFNELLAESLAYLYCEGKFSLEKVRRQMRKIGVLDEKKIQRRMKAQTRMEYPEEACRKDGIRYYQIVMEDEGTEDEEMGSSAVKAYPWFGGKYKFVDQIIPAIGKHNAYYEPFMGSAAVLLNKYRAGSEYLSDLDKGMVNLMKCIADEDLLDSLIEKVNRNEIETEEAFKEVLAVVERKEGESEPAMPDVEWAVAVYQSIAYSFNSLRKSFRYKDYAFENCDMWAVNERLQGVDISVKDAFDVLKDIRGGEETFVLLDPPYREALMGCKGAYRGGCMPDDKQEEMLDIIKDAEYRVMLCGYRAEEDDLYDRVLRTGRHQKPGDARRWRCYHLADASAPSGKEGEHRKLSEYIWVNYDLPPSAAEVISTEECGDLLEKGDGN